MVFITIYDSILNVVCKAYYFHITDFLQHFSEFERIYGIFLFRCFGDIRKSVLTPVRTIMDLYQPIYLPYLIGNAYFCRTHG